MLEIYSNRRLVMIGSGRLSDGEMYVLMIELRIEKELSQYHLLEGGGSYIYYRKMRERYCRYLASLGTMWYM